MKCRKSKKNTLRNFIRRTFGDGIIKRKPNSITFSVLSTNTYTAYVGVRDCTFLVDGYVIDFVDAEKYRVYYDYEEGDISVYLRVWEEIVDSTAILKKLGNQNDPNGATQETIPNWFKDSRVSEETSRRKVVKFDLSKERDDSKYCLLIAELKGGTVSGAYPQLYQKVRELKFNKDISEIAPTSFSVFKALSPFYSVGKPGVIGVYIDLENEEIRRIGENEDWEAGNAYTLGSEIYQKRRRCNVTNDGKVVSFYGDSNYTEKGFVEKSFNFYGEVFTENGSTSGPNNYINVGTEVQAMVMQPKFYYRRIPIKTVPVVQRSFNGKDVPVLGEALRVWVDLISPIQYEGFKLHPAFLRNGKELKYYFIGENHASMYYNNEYHGDDEQFSPAFDFGTNYGLYKLSSVAGVTGISTRGRVENAANMVRKMANNRGDYFIPFDITISSAEFMLYMVEYAELVPGVIKKFGKGVTELTNVNNSHSGMEITILPPIPENNISGCNSGCIPVTHTLSDGTSYSANVPVFRGVKNFMGYLTTFCDGIYVLRPSNTNKGACTPMISLDNVVIGNGEPQTDVKTLYPKANPSFSIPFNSKIYPMVAGYTEEYDWLFIPSDTDFKAINFMKCMGIYQISDTEQILYGWANGFYTIKNTSPFCWNFYNSNKMTKFGGYRLCMKKDTVGLLINVGSEGYDRVELEDVVLPSETVTHPI